MRLSFAGLSDRGRVRATNEDNWAAHSREGLFLVSDGMGGHNAGALASEVVAEGLPQNVFQKLEGLADLAEPLASSRLADSIAQLSRTVRAESKGEPGLDGMGATVVVAVIRGAHALLGSVGDSRAYLWRDGNLAQLTRDHSIIQLLLESGEITKEEIGNHPARGRITRYIGMDDDCNADVRAIELLPGDRLVLCTDGLREETLRAELPRLIARRLSPSRICRRLVDAANKAGGEDNVTVVAISLAAQRHPPKAAAHRKGASH